MGKQLCLQFSRFLPWALLFPVVLLLSSCASDSLTPIPRLPSDAEIEQYNALTPHDEQIVCRQEAELGSRFKRRVCYRRGYLESMEKQGQSVVDAMRQDGLLDNPLH